MVSDTKEYDRARLIEVLERELELARAREHAALEREHAALAREQTAREREALLLDILRQVGPTNLRIRAAGRAFAESSTAVPPLRQRISTLLKDHPQGMTRVQIQQALGTHKHLKHTLVGMARAKLLRRVETGIYALPYESPQA